MTDRRNELAVIRHQQLAQLRQKIGQPERMTVNCACAAHDRDYQATFARMPPATHFKCETMDKAESPSTIGVGISASVLRVPADEIDWMFSCPWCRTPPDAWAPDTWTLCPRCKSLICGARSDGNWFTCRPSCGASGRRTVPVRELPGAKAGGPGRKAIGHAAMKLLAGRRGP
jgi:hypothetical protein